MKSFWTELKARLGMADDGGEDAPEASASHAAAALLLEMTEADLEVDPEERDAVRRALAQTFGLDQHAIEQLLHRAEAEMNREASYHPHVETVNDLCGPEDKAAIVEQMWRVAFADGDLDKYEEHYLRKLCRLLHVPHRVFIQTRHKVEQELARASGGE